MIKSIGIGIILSLAILLVSTVVSLSIEQIFFVGLIILVLVAIAISGFGVSGDRMRANLATESKEDRNWRVKASINIFLSALPLLVGLIISHYLV